MFGSMRAADGRPIRTKLLLLFVVALIPFPTAVVISLGLLAFALGLIASAIRRLPLRKIEQ
jgi:uncharacterized membrane protein